MYKFYYVRTLEKLEIALLDMFNNIRVNKYSDISRTNYIKTVPVPIFTHTDKNFANYWRNKTSKKYPMPIPCGGLRFNSIYKNDENRTQSTYARSIFSKASQKWIQDIQPTPYYVNYNLEFLTDNRSDWGQIIENILPYFNTYRTLRIKEFDFFSDIEAKIPVYLEDIQTEFEDEIDASSASHRFIRLKLNLKCHVDLYRPFEIPEIIKYAELNINIDDIIHKHQVLVYPEPLVEKEKKDWETLSPSLREGFSLLKTIAGTLVKEVNLDGKVQWKEITAPDAIRPVKVPNFKELSLLFDDDTPNEIDKSGFGRDFVALNNNDRTYIPNFPPGSGQYAPDGYKSNSNWNNILTWFGTENGLNLSPYTFDIILQFVNNNPEDTIFQSLHNLETPNYIGNHTLPEGEVFFEWGLLSGKIYFTMRTVKFENNSFVEALSQTFITENKIQFNNTSIYRIVFVLYDKGREGIFGYSIDNSPIIALNTIKEK